MASFDEHLRPQSPLRPDVAPLFAIFRRLDPEVAVATAMAIAHAGVPALEITIESERSLEVVRRLRGELPGTAVGVGTVLDPTAVAAAVDAGAMFVVSPNVDESVIAACVGLGIPALPGAATPTEALRAWQAGASMVKLFPAATGGPAGLHAIHEPLPMIPLVAVGGVDGGNAKAYIEAGASGVGIGSWITAAGSPALAAERAATVVRLLQP